MTIITQNTLNIMKRTGSVATKLSYGIIGSFIMTLKTLSK